MASERGSRQLYVSMVRAGVGRGLLLLFIYQLASQAIQGTTEGRVGKGVNIESNCFLFLEFLCCSYSLFYMYQFNMPRLLYSICGFRSRQIIRQRSYRTLRQYIHNNHPPPQLIF